MPPKCHVPAFRRQTIVDVPNSDHGLLSQSLRISHDAIVY